MKASSDDSRTLSKRIEILLEIQRHDPQPFSQFPNTPIRLPKNFQRPTFPQVRIHIPADRPKQRRFSGSVGTNDRRILTGGDREGQVVEDFLQTTINIDVGDIENVRHEQLLSRMVPFRVSNAPSYQPSEHSFSGQTDRTKVLLRRVQLFEFVSQTLRFFAKFVCFGLQRLDLPLSFNQPFDHWSTSRVVVFDCFDHFD